MGIKVYKPTSPGRRHQTGSNFSDITKRKPEKSLTVDIKKAPGRNNQGRVTSRHRAGGVKRKYRIIDFRRDKDGVPAKVKSIEYDPNRSARIALLQYKDGEKRYIIASQHLKVGDEIISGDDAPVRPGNVLPLSRIPEGTSVYNIELKQGKGGQLVRSAGTTAELLSKEKKYAQLRLPSGEIRLVNLNCRATVGGVSNPEHENVQIGKAGRARLKGKRPHVRGSCMNPIDHPHGGGEGRSGPGRHPVSPWGKHAKGKKTRKKGKPSDKFIVKRRKK